MMSAQFEDRQGEETQVFVPETQFAFQTVVEGTEVVHDFAIINKGTYPFWIRR